MAREISTRIGKYTKTRLQRADVEIEPQLPGCGPITGGVLDLLASEHRARGEATVIEIKAVDRSFRSVDFRQLVGYAVLIFAARHYVPDGFAL